MLHVPQSKRLRVCTVHESMSESMKPQKPKSQEQAFSRRLDAVTINSVIELRQRHERLHSSQFQAARGGMDPFRWVRAALGFWRAGGDTSRGTIVLLACTVSYPPAEILKSASRESSDCYETFQPHRQALLPPEQNCLCWPTTSTVVLCH